jgi:hypothetical protein
MYFDFQGPQALGWISEGGAVNFGVVFFVCSFVLIVNWTLLQVCVAVLLESFVGTRRQREQKRLFGHMEDLIGLGMIRHPLDPLLEGLAREYTDDADLSRRLKELFEVNYSTKFLPSLPELNLFLIIWQVLDIDGSGGLSSIAFRLSIKDLVRPDSVRSHSIC